MIDNKLAGHYIVNEKVFYDKIQAILYANESKSMITWNYYAEVFSKINWMIEPETSLDEFYKIRAQQLRDKYDYLIAFCSGGADSTQVAHAFLKNGIKLDEIYAAAPLSGLKNFSPTDKNNHATNIVSETFFAQMPVLEKIRSEYPEVKITVNDYFEDILKYSEDEWLLTSSDWVHPTTNARYSLEKYDHIKKLIDQGKRVAAIYGANKPNVSIFNNNLNLNIEDLGMNVARPAMLEHEVYLEPFYTTPDLPLLTVKQAHAVAKWALESGQESRLDMMKFKSEFRQETSRKSWNGIPWNNGLYERAIVPAIYPTLEYNYFQGLKPNYQILADMDAWFYDLHKETRTYKMVLSDVSNFLKAVDVQYFRDHSKSGFKVFKNTYNFGNIFTYGQ